MTPDDAGRPSALTQTAEASDALRPPGVVPEITETVMPPSQNDGEMMALNDERASTDIENVSSGNESEDEHSRDKTRRARSLDSPTRRVRSRNIDSEYIKSNTLSTGEIVEIDISLLTAEQRKLITSK